MDEWEGRIAEIVASATAEQQRVWADFKQRQEAAVSRQYVWVQQLRGLADDIERHDRRTDWRTLELFWIRVFGVLDELGGMLCRPRALEPRAATRTPRSRVMTSTDPHCPTYPRTPHVLRIPASLR